MPRGSARMKLPLLWRVSEDGPLRQRGKAPGPSSESVQGRNPRGVEVRNAPRAMAIWPWCSGWQKPSRREDFVVVGTGSGDRVGMSGAEAMFRRSARPWMQCWAGIGPSSSVAGRWPARKARGGVGGVQVHEVSTLITTRGVVGRWRGWQPASKVSMMIMRPPQQGQGCESRCAGSASLVASAAGGTRFKSLRTVSVVSVRLLLASRP